MPFLGLGKDFHGLPAVVGLRLGFRGCLSFRMLRSSCSSFSKRLVFQWSYSLALKYHYVEIDVEK